MLTDHARGKEVIKLTAWERGGGQQAGEMQSARRLGCGLRRWPQVTGSRDSTSACLASLLPTITYQWWIWLIHCCHCCLVAESRPTLCDPTDCSPPSSSVHGISQARILEWILVDVRYRKSTGIHTFRHHEMRQKEKSLIFKRWKWPWKS